MASITSVSSSSSSGCESESTLSSKVLYVAKVIVQIVARIIFVIGSLVVAAAALPVEWFAIGLPIAALVSAVVSYNFFGDAAPSAPQAIPVQSAAVEPLPKDAPLGIINTSNNCAFNSLVHFWESSPEIADWIRKPLSAQDVCQQVIEEARLDPTIDLTALQDSIEKSEAPASSKIAYFVTRHRKILSTHDAFQIFWKSYSTAVEKGVRQVEGSQKLREALHQIDPKISISERVQEDASECFTHLLDLLPANKKLSWKISRFYDLTPFTDAANRPDSDHRDNEEVVPYIPLSMEQDGSEALHIQKMLDHELDKKEAGVEANITGKDGVATPCKNIRTKLELLNAPPALYLQIKRFDSKVPEGKSEATITKNETPVEAPLVLKIKVGGVEKIYQLSSFVHHSGSTPSSGHYRAGRLIDGKRYLLDDERVTLDDPAWERLLQQAYLLCYVPVQVNP